MESALCVWCYVMHHCEGRGLDRVSNEEARSPGFVLSLVLMLVITQHLETLASREMGEMGENPLVGLCGNCEGCVIAWTSWSQTVSHRSTPSAKCTFVPR